MERTIKVTEVGAEAIVTRKDVLNLLGIHPEDSWKLKSHWIKADEEEAYHLNLDAPRYYLYAKKVS